MKRTFIAAFLGAVCSTAMAHEFQRPIDRIINQIDPNINMGIEVVDLSTGKRLYHRNETNRFIPASNMKLFSDAAALLALGPEYRFTSQLSTDATSIDQGTLKGSLYLTLSGDPSFTSQHLKTLLSSLKTWGVRHIHGNMVIVSSHRMVSPYAPGIVPKDLTQSYGAPLAPLILDENRLTVTINPAYRAGAPALVEYGAPAQSLVVNNQVKTAQAPAKCGVSLSIDQTGQLTTRGCVLSGQGAVIQRIPIRYPLQYAEGVLRAQLAALHIGFDGQVVLGQSASKSLLLASHVSKPITQLMADTLKPSDNLYADSLFLQAAAKLHGSPVNWNEAQPIIKTFLQQQTGIALQQATLVDGSGLSRLDLVTPKQTIQLLRYLYHRFPLAYEYITALPIAGQDGTLQRRLRKPTQQGFVRAKTGSMTGIMSLSGYLYTANAHTLAFAIYINTRKGTSPSISGQYRTLVDHLCDYLLQQKPDSRWVATPRNPHARVAYQQQPTRSETLRRRQAKWRGLELALKKSLNNQPVTLLFRHGQLVLLDHNPNSKPVWTILQSLKKKYAFGIALHDQSPPVSGQGILWVNSVQNEQAKRTWTLRGVLG